MRLKGKEQRLCKERIRSLQCHNERQVQDQTKKEQPEQEPLALVSPAFFLSFLLLPNLAKKRIFAKD
jgi:hypothetical protein